ncbi:HAMP domain-containing sensor histidine kinase [Nocardioides sp.]|uniref:sensor histidine kinase n=1 Tax=Nocardioides sp. TaxID=35761 RepID=UPI00286A173B|nr:HAMP domain-containing sensor histidine kinase [Nocardioides sp.]
MRSLPVRWRITGAFTVAMLLLMVLAGVFVYLRLDEALDRHIDHALRSRTAQLIGSADTQLLDGRTEPADPGSPSAAVLESDENPVQVLSADGEVLRSSARASVPLVSPSLVRGIGDQALFVDRTGDALFDESVRLLVTPLPAEGPGAVLVVGESLDEKHEAMVALLTTELIGLAAAIVGSAVVGYLMTGVALRPVEDIRREAETIRDLPLGRLPEPRANDELGRLGRTLNGLLERVQQSWSAEQDAIARERRFIADASHQLRTPLTTLKSELDVALIGPHEAAQLRLALESAREETDRICRLADDLLLLAQAEHAAGAAHPHDVDVAHLLGEAARRNRARADSLDRPITVQVVPGLHLWADPDQIALALDALLENALTHGAGPVTLSATSDADHVQVTIRDQGQGFPQDFLPTAFDRFTRPAASRGQPGTGLGLAIVRALARHNHGDVTVLEALPGAAVMVSLPSTEVSPPRRGDLQGHRESSRTTSPDGVSPSLGPGRGPNSPRAGRT